MVVVARTVKEAPDWEPQCGVGMGGMASAFTPLLLSSDGDVIIVMVFAHEHICALCVTEEFLGSMTRWTEKDILQRR